MAVDDPKNYKRMENILNTINKLYISLPKDEVDRNNQILSQVLEPLTKKIKEKSSLFKRLYEKQFYGGSFYDGIKIGKPEEYDLDYILNLPAIIESDIEVSDRDGFVHVHIKEYPKLKKHNLESSFEKLDELLTANNTYLSTVKVLIWMEKIMNHALNQFERTTEGHCFNIVLKEQKFNVYVSLSKAHPAFTLRVRNKENNISLDVDLVPCFKFSNDKWPKGSYRRNETKKPDFLVVPKKPYGSTEADDVEKYWRLSFQEQERELMKGSNNKALKPACKLLKKLRDKHNHNIASYFIKTVLLWELEKREDSFWQQSLSYVFIKVLESYAEMVKSRTIPYYWNKNFNLINHLKESTLFSIGNNLQNIVDNVKKSEDPYVVAKYLIQQNELEELIKEMGKYKSTAVPDLSSGDEVDLSKSTPKNGQEDHSNNMSFHDHIAKGDDNSEKNILQAMRRMETKIEEITDNLNQLTSLCLILMKKVIAIEEKMPVTRSDSTEVLTFNFDNRQTHLDI